MVRAGKCVCHVCGKLSGVAYYNSGQSQTGALLKRSLTGRYHVVPYNPHGEVPAGLEMELAEQPGENTVFKYVTVKTTVNGVPSGEEIFYRSCPKCRVNTKMLDGHGLLPTYVVAMVGKKGSGKSSWVQAVFNYENIKRVNAADFPYSIDAYEYTKLDGEAKPTNENSVGDTKLLKITEKKRNRDVALVMFRDVAGELFEEERRGSFDESGFSRVLLGDKDYPGADAIVFIDNIDKSADDTLELFNMTRKVKGMRNKITAYILNRLDAVQGRYITTEGMTDGDRVPLLDRNTFASYSRGDAFDKEVFFKRVSLQNMIAKKMRSYVSGFDGAKCNGFLVKTCTPSPDGVTSDFRSPINVMDPLIWLLSQIGVFPLD